MSIELTDIVDAYRCGGITNLINGGLRLTRRKFASHIFYPSLRQIGLYRQYKLSRQKSQSIEYANELISRDIGERIDDCRLTAYKNSDTLFVLGSGDSINEITDDQWKHINSCDSIGLNRWPVHEFIPTYHVFELRMPSEMQRTYWDLLDYRKDSYVDIPVILKDVVAVTDTLDPTKLPEWLSDEIIISVDSNYSDIINWETDSQTHRAFLRLLKEKGYFQKGKLNIPLYRQRGSISYLLHLAVALNYDEVILCGVDMVNSKYFFDKESYDEKSVPIPYQSDTVPDSTHKTNDQQLGNLTLEQVIYDIDDVILSDFGIDLYVENEISALHPRVPLYNYK